MDNTMKFLLALLLITQSILVTVQRFKIIELEKRNDIQARTIESQYYALESYGYYNMEEK